MDKYKVTFKDGTDFTLFSEEYFCDNVTFWRYHQNNLKQFSTYVKEKGRPIEVKDKKSSRVTEFTNADEFDKWYKIHQAKELDFD